VIYSITPELNPVYLSLEVVVTIHQGQEDLPVGVGDIGNIDIGTPVKSIHWEVCLWCSVTIPHGHRQRSAYHDLCCVTTRDRTRVPFRGLVNRVIPKPGSIHSGAEAG
jgi:hypothetical protein